MMLKQMSKQALAAHWDVKNMMRRVDRARHFPDNTDPCSRHLQIMAVNLVRRGKYEMLQEEPAHCAQSMLAVLECLFKARTELARLKAATK